MLFLIETKEFIYNFYLYVNVLACLFNKHAKTERNIQLRRRLLWYLCVTAEVTRARQSTSHPLFGGFKTHFLLTASTAQNVCLNV